MAKVKGGTSRLNSVGLVNKGRSIVTMMTGDRDYPTLQDMLPPITEACDNLAVANEQAASVGGKLVFEAKRKGEAALRSLISDLAHAVQVASGGDSEKILGAGFDVVRKAQRQPLPGEIQDFQAVYTPYAASAKLRWTGQEVAKFYQIEQLDENGKWTLVATTTRTVHTIKCLVSGQRYSFRVFAIGTAGASPASQVVETKAA